MVELVVAVTFLAVGAWWFLTREEKKEVGSSEGGEAPACDSTVSIPCEGEVAYDKYGNAIPCKDGYAIPCDKELNKLTKVKLEEFGRTVGVELDRRKTKANMIADLKEAVK